MQLRRNKRRERDRPTHEATEATQTTEGTDSCPVCFSPFGAAELSRSLFPCGHAVCRTCDQQMRTRAFFSCPVCRTPREGFSRAEVDAAAQARALNDAAEEERDWGVHSLGSGANAGVPVYARRSSMPAGGVSVVFFRADGSGDPFDSLRTALLQSAPRRGTRTGAGAAVGRVHGALLQNLDGEDENAAGIADDDEASENRVPAPAPAAEVVLAPDVRQFIEQHLLNPTPLEDAIAARVQLR